MHGANLSYWIRLQAQNHPIEVRARGVNLVSDCARLTSSALSRELDRKCKTILLGWEQWNGHRVRGERIARANPRIPYAGSVPHSHRTIPTA